MAVRLPTPTPAIPTHSNSVFGRGPDEILRANSPTVHKLSSCCPRCVVMIQPPNVHSTFPIRPQKTSFVTRLSPSHTLRKYSTRPYDTTRSNLTGSQSRRAARSQGAAQKSVLHRDQRLFAATARIDPAATGLQCFARSIRSGDERDGSRPGDVSSHEEQIS